VDVEAVCERVRTGKTRCPWGELRAHQHGANTGLRPFPRLVYALSRDQAAGVEVRVAGAVAPGRYDDEEWQDTVRAGAAAWLWRVYGATLRETLSSTERANLEGQAPSLEVVAAVLAVALMVAVGLSPIWVPVLAVMGIVALVRKTTRVTA
jgi:hypothetical protein